MRYQLSADSWDEKEFEAIDKVVKSRQFTMGAEVKQFEQEFAAYFGSKYAVMVNSGSSANLLAIASLFYHSQYKLCKGDEVIVPAVSWSTTYAPLQQYGLKVKFVDINIDTLNIDIDQLKKAITSKTKAIFAVNLLGNPNEYNEILSLCKDKNIILLEDNCEAMGAKYQGKYTGTFGLMGTFSTFYSHHISTMEGGMIVTDDFECYEILKSIRAHGWTRDLSDQSPIYEKKSDEFYEKFNFILPGYNVRPLEMEAAIGREQLKKLGQFIVNRRNNAQEFFKLFSQQAALILQKEIGENSYFGFSLIVKDNHTVTRDQIVAILMQNGIDCRPIVTGNFTKNTVIKYFDYEIHDTLIHAELLHTNGLFIGNHHYDCKDQLAKVYNVINSLFQSN